MNKFIPSFLILKLACMLACLPASAVTLKSIKAVDAEMHKKILGPIKMTIGTVGAILDIIHGIAVEINKKPHERVAEYLEYNSCDHCKKRKDEEKFWFLRKCALLLESGYDDTCSSASIDQKVAIKYLQKKSQRKLTF